MITSSLYKNDLSQSLTNVKDKQKGKGKGRENRSLKGVKKDKRKQVPKATKKQKKGSSSRSEGEEDYVPADDDDSDNSEFPDSQSPELSVNVNCMFCDVPFAEDNQGEIWIKCFMCNLWAHNECSRAEKEEYVCDFRLF